MSLLLVILLILSVIFVIYYEFVWKKVEKEKGRSLVAMARDFVMREKEEAPSSTLKKAEGNWNDWRYRLLVELYRREQLTVKEAADIAEISEKKAEDYLDRLEGEGKVRQVGDAERGIYYKIIPEELGA